MTSSESDSVLKRGILTDTFRKGRRIGTTNNTGSRRYSKDIKFTVVNFVGR